MGGPEQSEAYRQLEQAIAALQAQRSLLGDAVVDPAIAALQSQLAELEASWGRQSRKQITVLYADFSGYTALSEKMDAEELSDIMNELWEQLDSPVLDHGGLIDKHMGDGVMALWGAKTVREDDPECALRAALAMQQAASAFSIQGSKLKLRIGIHTGPVLLGEVGTTGEFTALGDTVNLAQRLEEAAPTGGVLISHDTYRQVRGIFDVLPQEPIQVKGKSKPLHTYLVQQAKPRAFHMENRGVEGIETRMVGRDAELLTLQNIFRDAMEDAETRVVTVVGDAGVGKSRLLYEFEKWVELLPEDIWYFTGWASPAMQTTSYDVIRRMFTHRFEILESDSAAEVMEKFRLGMSIALNPNQADLVGHLIGFDFSTSQVIQDALKSASFKERSIEAITAYFRSIAREPTVIFLEDMHWADDNSLNLVDHLAEAIPDAHLLVVCLARPALYERRQGWGEGRDAHIKLDLKALSRRESRALVTEILQKVDEVPLDLRELVVEGAEGNPFYVEELIKMLIEDGVIRPGEERWQIEIERLAEVDIPPTLAGVLQARLDSLPPQERVLLQRASVVGRLFWDMAVAELAAADESSLHGEELVPLLEAVRERELVFRLEHSAFSGTEEYKFKHALLRDVTYETVLMKLRRVYHRQVAAWLESTAGDRVGEYLGLIAYHYEMANDADRSVAYLLRAGDRARLAYAHEDAIDYYLRALVFLKEGEAYESAARTLMKLGLVYHTAFDYQRSRQAYEEGFAVWQQAQASQPVLPALSSSSTLRKTLRESPLTLDPTMTNQAYSSVPIIQLFSGLVEGSVATEVTPDVARSWEISEGGRQYIFHLREDARWSDGVPVTAGDFEFAWKRTLDPQSGSPNASLLFDIKGAREFHLGEVTNPGFLGIQSPDDLTLVVELESPTGYFLSLLARYATFPIPRHALQDHGENWAQAGSIITNGAFRLESWDPGESMVLTRNPAYHGQRRGNLQRVELSFNVEDSAVLEMYEAGDIDILGLREFLPSEWDRARREHASECISAPESASHCIGFDIRQAPFNDPRVRQAFALATDRTKLANEILGGYEFPATGGFIPSGIPGHASGIGFLFNPEVAQRLLYEAGYPAGSNFPRVKAIARERTRSQVAFLQAQWQEILGVEIAWEVMPWQQFFASLKRAPAHIIEFGWMADYPDPDSFLRSGLNDTKEFANWGDGWRDKTYENLVEKARQVIDQEERLKLYAQADRILIESAVIIPLTYSWYHVLVKPWVRKFPASEFNQWLWKDIVIESH